MSDIRELERLAKAATPGPWHSILPGDIDWQARRKYRCVAFGKRSADYTTSPLLVPDAAYIAAVSPDVILALLARVARLEEALPANPYMYMASHVGPDGDDVYDWSCYACTAPQDGSGVHADDCAWVLARAALAVEPKWRGPGETRHAYSPDVMAMGDCKVCGHIWEDHQPAALAVEP